MSPRQLKSRSVWRDLSAWTPSHVPSARQRRGPHAHDSLALGELHGSGDRGKCCYETNHKSSISNGEAVI